MPYGRYNNDNHHYGGGARYVSSDDEDYGGRSGEGGYGGDRYGYQNQERSGYAQVRNDYRNDYGNRDSGYANHRSSDRHYESGRSDGYAPSAYAIRKDEREDRNVPDDYVEVHTDGACRNNGRRSPQAGYGSFWGDNHPNNSHGRVEGEQTNNRGELQAIRETLRDARDQGYDKIRIKTDSRYAEQSMNKWIDKWRDNDYTTASGNPVKNRDLIEDIDRLCDDIDVQFEHVPGHKGNYGNEQADRLAKRGAGGRGKY